MNFKKHKIPALSALSMTGYQLINMIHDGHVYAKEVLHCLDEAQDTYRAHDVTITNAELGFFRKGLREYQVALEALEVLHLEASEFLLSKGIALPTRAQLEEARELMGREEGVVDR